MAEPGELEIWRDLAERRLRTLAHYMDREARMAAELIALRKREPLLIQGHTQMLLPDHEQIAAYLRTSAPGEAQLLVLCNFSADRVVFELPQEVAYQQAELLLGNYTIESADLAAELRNWTLRPYEAMMVKLG